MLIISDNSALSALAETGLMDLLPALFGRIVITGSVLSECSAQGPPPELRSWISRPPDWLSIVPDPVVLLDETACLDSGEAASITLAWGNRPESFLILDERRGRRVAQALGLPMAGVMAIIADAANLGLVDFEDALQRLLSVGFQVSDEVIAAVRRRLVGWRRLVFELSSKK